MEHGLNSLTSVHVSDCMKNGVASPIMANFPDGPLTQSKENQEPNEAIKTNGEGGKISADTSFEDSYSSESDALVIDESIPKKKNRSRRNKRIKDSVTHISDENGANEIRKLDTVCEQKSQVQPNNNSTDTLDFISNENTQTSETSNEHRISDCGTPVEPSKDGEISSHSEVIPHSNPFFNESLFELSQQHHSNSDYPYSDLQNNSERVSRSAKHIRPVAKPKPKFTEHAQFLGLQPAVQFKCPKCHKSGFDSLPILHDHFLLCNGTQPSEKLSANENVSGFKLTRRVFLCSACGTYYETSKLYLHMLEYHKRYLCLYCLGMFSVLDDLCHHLQKRHSIEPGIKNSLEDFYNTYNEPCYVVCCECNQQFNEGDNFFYHNCISAKTAKGKAKQAKSVIAPENHITGDFGAATKAGKAADTDKNNCSSDTKVDPSLEMVNNIEKSPVVTIDSPVNDEVDLDFQGNKNKINCDDSHVSKPSESDNSDSDNLTGENNLDISNNTRTSENVEDDNDDQGSVASFQSFQNNQEVPVENNMGDNSDGQCSDSNDNGFENTLEPVETRKVPKLSLKLPKPCSYQEPEDSDYSDKGDNMEINNIESENDNDHSLEHPNSEQGEEQEQEKMEEIPDDSQEHQEENGELSLGSEYHIAGADINIVEIQLDQPLDKMDITVLLQICLKATVPTCIYCNHSRRIAVNGKQLALHAMSEHRYSAINKSITEEELIPESFNLRIKECLGQLETVFFNLDSGVAAEAVTFSHKFECFQCRYSSTVHKELYLHNRKFHSKNLLLCIMCKSNFYSYSELICHLCPGVYVLDYDIQFRCCMCVREDLPSSFRLMVHLRKKHNFCDVCLELCHSQYKLSNHVWKHKLHHFCYRCGIAYRNKPDITRHLFWKHGTESVMCKKCLQKKWPHVYHFCVPPASFTCEECNLSFTRAVSLKVHKRLHSDEKKHACTWEECTEAFISKKLMLRHLRRHTEPPEEVKVEEEIKEEMENKMENEENKDPVETLELEEPKVVKPKVDVLNDLPALNLSESDSSDSEEEQEKPKHIEESVIKPDAEQSVKLEDNAVSSAVSDLPVLPHDLNLIQPEQFGLLSAQPVLDDTSSSVIQDIWDNFKNYQASKEKIDSMFIGEIDPRIDLPYIPDIPIPEVQEGVSASVALLDHDYCKATEETQDAIIEVKPSLESTESIDHDYCFLEKETEGSPAETVPIAVITTPKGSPEKDEKTPKKRTTSSSSSSSDSDSSCACGSSCSCSDSSSGSSSSSSDSSNSDSSTEEGRKKQLQRRLKRKERTRASKKITEVAQESVEPPQVQQTRPITTSESDQKVDILTSDQPPVVVEMPIRESDLETTESETDEEFYDREPQKFAKKILEEKRAQLLAEMGPNMVPNGSFIESTSRPPTPPAGTVEEEEQPKRKKKTKKRKKRRSEKKANDKKAYLATLMMDIETVVPPPSIPYYQQFHQTGNHSPAVPPITLTISKNSPARITHTPPPFTSKMETPILYHHDSSDSNVRSSKRRRVPNRFYGYSSDEESDKPHKRIKVENNRTIPAPESPPKLVPPITIRPPPPSSLTVRPRTPTVEPITLKLPKPLIQNRDYKRDRSRPTIPPIRLSAPRPIIPPHNEESATESNDSDYDETPQMQSQILSEVPKPQLYCYCRCPYDEVSEMIGCDANDCQIEWFHFECVGIMVPPKGQWYCPDCRKKKQQRGLN